MSEQLAITVNDLEPTNYEDAQAAFNELWLPESEYFDPARSKAESLCQDVFSSWITDSTKPVNWNEALTHQTQNYDR